MWLFESITKFLISLLFFKYFFSPLHILLASTEREVDVENLGRKRTSRVIALFHSLVTFSVGIFSLPPSNFSVCLINGFIMAYFYYDYLQAVERYTERGGGDGDPLVNPKGVLFHHVIATMLLHGLLFFDTSIAATIFCLGEGPVFLINVNWLQRFYGGAKTRQFKLVSHLIVCTYCARVALFLVGFICFAIPQITLLSLLNPLTYIALFCLLLIFFFNLIWLAKLLYPKYLKEKHFESLLFIVKFCT